MAISADPAVAALQRSVASAARDLVGQRVLRIRGRTYRSDCSGTIRAAYWAAGIDLDTVFAEKRGNGVARLHAIARDYADLRGRVLDPVPALGDILFWDNTYDRNGDGLWNDPLTHAGIVVSVQPDGWIEYVHYHYRKGIVVERMDLFAPNDPERNDAMRMRGQRAPSRDLWLSSHLFREAGSPYLIAYR